MVLLMVCVLELITELQEEANINQEAKEGVKSRFTTLPLRFFFPFSTSSSAEVFAQITNTTVALNMIISNVVN